MYHFLKGSQLINKHGGEEKGSLRQDRYSIRTASQWIGPVLEDCALAYNQIIIECNSVTDNPLTDPESGDSLHGGNFQAKAITSAMEKTRQGVHSLGRMLFTQCTEVINPDTNNGLPPNLTIDPPSQSFIMKGVDILCASLLSELGYLANPVNHVQTAEMGNQALNSLALISARYTHTSCDLLSKLCAAHILVVCQAIDLRAIRKEFLCSLETPFRTMTSDILHEILFTDPHQSLWSTMVSALNDCRAVDAPERFKSVVVSLQPTVLSHVHTNSSGSLLALLSSWTESMTALLDRTHRSSVKAYLADGNASPLLGKGARLLYDFIRRDLQIPFLHEGMLDTQGSDSVADKAQTSDNDAGNLTIGDYLTVIHEAIRQGVLFLPVMEAIREAQDTVAKELDSKKAGLHDRQQQRADGWVPHQLKAHHEHSKTRMSDGAG